MSKVKKLVLQGQVNAVEFFGVSLENLTDVKIDFLDELRSLVDGNNFHHGFGHQRRVRVLYKGRAIEVTNFFDQWDAYINNFLETSARLMHSLHTFTIKGGATNRIQSCLALLCDFSELR